jgi:hypothetical protein
LSLPELTLPAGGGIVSSSSSSGIETSLALAFVCTGEGGVA